MLSTTSTPAPQKDREKEEKSAFQMEFTDVINCPHPSHLRQKLEETWQSQGIITYKLWSVDYEPSQTERPPQVMWSSCAHTHLPDLGLFRESSVGHISGWPALPCSVMVFWLPDTCKSGKKETLCSRTILAALCSAWCWAWTSHNSLADLFPSQITKTGFPIDQSSTCRRESSPCFAPFTLVLDILPAPTFLRTWIYSPHTPQTSGRERMSWKKR